ncbi:MAG: GNAT family N-acetyltransferase [Candidatus Lokiarchaeota archaeon]|nr:GNAT family N-acetyltransferase [Candidatus Lokiarchaeota archaeon]
MKIKELEQKDEEQFNQLAEELGTIYSSAKWAKLFGENATCYGIYDGDSSLIGGFSIFKMKQYGFSIYRDLPFTPEMGPFFLNNSQSHIKKVSKWKKLSELIAEHLKKLPFSVMSLSLNHQIVDTQPFIWKKFKVVPRYKYILELNKSVEEIWQNMASDTRNEIKKGEKDGLKVEKTDDYSLIHTLVNKTFSRQKMDIDQKYVERILFDFANDNNSVAYITYDDEKPIAGALMIYDKNSSHGLLSGYDHNSKHRGALSMCIWETMKYCKEIGLKHYDFEGSMIPRYENFLRRFGGTLTPYYVINRAKLPYEFVLKFFKREIF